MLYLTRVAPSATLYIWAIRAGLLYPKMRTEAEFGVTAKIEID